MALTLDVANETRDLSVDTGDNLSRIGVNGGVTGAVTRLRI
jgi:hypothetical protein